MLLLPGRSYPPICDSMYFYKPIHRCFANLNNLMCIIVLPLWINVIPLLKIYSKHHTSVALGLKILGQENKKDPKELLNRPTAMVSDFTPPVVNLQRCTLIPIPNSIVRSQVEYLPHIKNEIIFIFLFYPPLQTKPNQTEIPSFLVYTAQSQYHPPNHRNENT